MTYSVKSMMRYFTPFLFWSIILILFATPASADRSSYKKNRHKKAVVSKPVVNAVMFWMNDCSHCTRVKNKVLPPLYEKYGELLQIKMIQVISAHDEKALYSIAASHKLEEEETGVPFLMVGDKVFVGDKSIEREFPGIIAKAVALKGIPFPDDPILKAYLAAPRPVEAEPMKSKAKAQESFRAGMAMAGVIAVIMISALIASLVSIFYPSGHGNRFLADSPWPDRIIPLLCIVGLGVAGYLTKIEYSGNAPFCGVVHGCDKVQSSEYAWIIKDLLPVGLVGLLGYVAMLGAWLWGRLSRGNIGSLMPLFLYVAAAFGTTYSIYLTFIELFVLKAACIWCLISADLLVLILLLSLPKAIKSRYRSGIWRFGL